jgi:hypothetical protein
VSQRDHIDPAMSGQGDPKNLIGEVVESVLAHRFGIEREVRPGVDLGNLAQLLFGGDDVQRTGPFKGKGGGLGPCLDLSSPGRGTGCGAPWTRSMTPTRLGQAETTVSATSANVSRGAT